MKKLLLLLAPALILTCLAAEPADQSRFPYEGEYQLESGGWVTVTRMGVVDEMAQPMFVDWESGRNGELAALGENRFVSPSPEKPDSPRQTEIVFRRDPSGRVAGLTLTEKGEEPKTALRAEPWAVRDITFPSGGISLSGTLLLPKAAAPLPAVVLVHGSGPGSRIQLSAMASFFAHLGMATLTYDKRGCGRSEGDWKQVDLEELAADALAGVKRLRAEPGIDAGRVGLWGISQGGWITPLAGSMDRGVAFVINSSGPGTSLRRQDLYMMANMLKAAGVGEAETDLVLRTFGTLYDFGRGKAAAEALDELSEKVRRNPALKELALPPAREITPDALYAQQAVGDPAWFYHLDPDRDALAPYRKLRCPLLVTYGKLDITVPVEESARLISETLQAAEHPDYLVKVLENAGHGLGRMRDGTPPSPVEPGFVSREFFDTIGSWLRERGFCGGKD